MAPSIDMIVERNKSCDIEFPKELWKNVSPEALDLVIKMTERDQYNRLSAKECLEHGWFRKSFKTPVSLKAAIVNMQKYGV